MRFSLCDTGHCACNRIPKAAAEAWEDWTEISGANATRFSTAKVTVGHTSPGAWDGGGVPSSPSPSHPSPLKPGWVRFT